MATGEASQRPCLGWAAWQRNEHGVDHTGVLSGTEYDSPSIASIAQP